MLQKIDLYCKNCKKSMKMTYELTGDDHVPVMNGMTIRCHTHKCIRVVALKNFTEGQMRSRADAQGRYYL